MKTIGYTKIQEMEPRPGVRYATKYYKQSHLQRETLVDWIRKSALDIVECVDNDRDFAQWWTTPIKEFRKTDRTHRTPQEIVTDLLLEATGSKRNGEHKDFAQAPIERWNRLFRETPYEFSMVQTLQDKLTTFDSIMVFENV
jgi:hypothetical protein